MCQYCKHPHPLKRHPTRKHKRPPREFWLCPCGETVQGIEKQRVDGSTYVKEIPVRPRKPSRVIPIRVSLDEWKRWKKSGLTARQFIKTSPD